MIDETKKMKLDPATLLNPVPVVMVSCSGKNKTDPQDRPNIITLAWLEPSVQSRRWYPFPYERVAIRMHLFLKQVNLLLIL